jgi:DNA-binding response OmpR family regulator
MSERRAANAGATVLVVDDDGETADLYADFLDGYAVETAYSGAEALDLVDDTIDVVLLDRRMPAMSGGDMLKSIRERGLGCRVVMVTAADPDLDVLELPFDDYLVKPVSRDAIRDAVSRMLERNSYDEVIEEVVELASEMATLEAKLTIEELEESDEYAHLEAKLDELRAGPGVVNPANNTYATFTTEKIETLVS